MSRSTTNEMKSASETSLPPIMTSTFGPAPMGLLLVLRPLHGLCFLQLHGARRAERITVEREHRVLRGEALDDALEARQHVLPDHDAVVRPAFVFLAAG